MAKMTDDIEEMCIAIEQCDVLINILKDVWKLNKQNIKLLQDIQVILFAKGIIDKEGNVIE